MSNVREAEEAIRRYNDFKIDGFTLNVKVAKSDEQKKKEAQQKQVRPTVDIVCFIPCSALDKLLLAHLS